MASTGDIKRRIKSIGSTRKITKAMEMVSAAKMKKAINAVLKTRTYANLSWETILNIANASAGNGQPLHPLLQKKGEGQPIAIIVITSNRGLCGGFNAAIISKVNDSIKKHHKRNGNKDIGAELVLIGRKGEALARYGYSIVADFPKTDVVTGVAEVIPLARMVTRDFISGKYGKVMVAYTDFVNAAKQVPRIKQLLPVEIEKEDEYLGIMGQDTRVGLDKKFIAQKMDKHTKDEIFKYDYKFEPNEHEVLDAMIPRLIEVQLFQALLESNASEHSARMSAMHQATEAANDMADELTLFYNKARQANITRELAEISAGANALEE
jgi:F-type H+-transporting ATPase subunit gamma